MKLTINQALFRAKKLINDGELKEALKLIKTILGQSPKHILANKMYAELNSKQLVIHETSIVKTDKLNYIKKLFHDKKFDEAHNAALEVMGEFKNSHEFWNILGSVCLSTGQYGKAERAFLNSISIKSTAVEVLCNLGTALKNQGKFIGAIEKFKHAIQLDNKYPGAHYGLALCYKGTRELDNAIKALKNALKLSQENQLFKLALVELYFQTNSYNEVNELLPDLLNDTSFSYGALPSLQALNWEDNALNQKMRSIARASTLFKSPGEEVIGTGNRENSKIKVGYFSADFHKHATLYLMMGLFSEYDKDRFEIYVYSYGPVAEDSWTKKVKNHVDKFFYVAGMSDIEISQLAKSHVLDIAIDLKGYTQYARLGIFQARVAPVQISYLGYPGTLGAPFFDYIIADPTIIDSDTRQAYTENVIYLPNSYQPNDNKRHIQETKTTRADFGLPDDSFVLCCFNNTGKIGMSEFEIWMRIMAQYNDTVLWLFKSNKWAEVNLRGVASRHGIKETRLIFAEPVEHAEHLARHVHADLFIDTFNYNAHTTASDALWAGLPLITKKGEQFSARVGASLLNAVNLPELITYSDKEYEEKITYYVRNQTELKNIREKLHILRKTAPLFDTSRYVKNFEKALQLAFMNKVNKQLVGDIIVPSET